MVESTKTGREEFGATVRRARERLGMTRRDLAETTSDVQLGPAGVTSSSPGTCRALPATS